MVFPGHTWMFSASLHNAAAAVSNVVTKQMVNSMLNQTAHVFQMIPKQPKKSFESVMIQKFFLYIFVLSRSMAFNFAHIPRGRFPHPSPTQLEASKLLGAGEAAMPWSFWLTKKKTYDIDKKIEAPSQDSSNRLGTRRSRLAACQTVVLMATRIQ